MEPDLNGLIPTLRPYVARILSHQAASEREHRLQTTADLAQAAIESDSDMALTFICTHNSRRSHLAHVWAEVAARCFGLDGVRCFSGGTEATSCNPRTIQAFVRAGFSVELPDGETDNPIVRLHYHEDAPAVECFSKVYNEAGNPSSRYIAMMCCSDVSEKCPVVHGATERIPLHYEDPKVADGTTEEEQRYDERCFQIGCDMFRLMSIVSERRTSI